MRFYWLLNFQHVMLFLFSTLVFIILLGLGLGYTHIRRADSDRRMTEVTEHFPDGIQERNAPFPLMLTWIIAATVVWAFLYILFHGLLQVKI